MTEATTYEFTLIGATALLMHFDNLDGADEVKEWLDDPANQKIKKGGDDRCPPWTWTTYVYHDGKSVCVPAVNVMTCLRVAGARVPMNNRKTFKEVTQTGIRPLSEFYPLYTGEKLDRPLSVAPITALRESNSSFADHKKGVQKQGFTLDARRARIGQAKHVRVRPRFDNWKVVGRIEVTAQEITPEKLATIFDIAGQVGLGDWRPGCKTPGTFGMFQADVKAI